MGNEFGLTTDIQLQLLTRALPHAIHVTHRNWLGGSPVVFNRDDERQLKKAYKRVVLDRWKSDPQLVQLASAAYAESPKKFIFVAPLAWLLGQAVTAVFSWLVWRVLDYLWLHRNSRLLGIAAQEVAALHGDQ